MNTLLGFELLRPALSLLLLASPVLLALGLASLRARRRARFALVAQRHQDRFFKGISSNRARVRVVLATVAVFMLAFSLLGPVRGSTLREVKRRGLDLVLCLDTSRSMLVQDLDPNRLERAKREISHLFDMLGNDRAALVAFSGDVRNVAPLTRDSETLRWFLSSLSPDDNVKGGTDLGGAITYALELFDGRTGAHEAIVLLTDGEDLEANGLAAARAAAERGIRIYVVGMGTEGGGKIPDGRRGFVRDDNNAEVVSILDSTTLEDIAAATGGAFIAADRSALPLEELYQKRISQLEGRELREGKERIPHDRFQWPLVLALLCMLLELGLSERRPGDRQVRE